MKIDNANTLLFYDLVNNTLKFSENPGKLGKYLTESMRELIGCRAVILQYVKEKELKLLDVCPARKRELFDNEKIIAFSKACQSLNRTGIINKNEKNTNIRNAFLELDVEQSIYIPLHIGTENIGALIIHDLLSDIGNMAVLSALENLAGVVALTLKNALSFQYLEEIVEERTMKLHMKNHEYIALNEEYLTQNEELIKEKNKAEQQATDLQLAQQIANIGNWQFDPELGFPVWSDQIFEIYERNPEQGLPHIDEYKSIYEPDQYQIFNASFSAAVQQGKNYDIVLKLKLPSGNVKWIRAICQPDVKRKNEFGYFLRGTIQDITQLKNAEIDLLRAKEIAEENEAKFRGLFDKVAEAIFIYNPHTFEILQANKATSEIYGYGKTELIGMSCLKFSAELEKSVATAENILKQGEAIVKFRHHKKKDGTYVFVEVNAYKITANNKDVMFSVCKDITDKVLAEKALSSSEMKFRALFEQSGGYCMILDPNTQDGIPIILDANEAACREHGYARDEFIGRPVSIINDEEGKQLVRERTALILEGQPFFSENVHVRKDGSVFHVAVNAKRIDIEGEAPMIFSTEYDISEQKRTEQELINSKEKAEESDRLKTAFLQNMSHEIRTPMNAIVGFSGRLNRAGLSPEKHQAFVKIIQNSSHQLLSIVTDILTISSLETKQEKINVQKVCVNTIIVELVSIFKIQAHSKNISLFSKMELTDKQSEIYTDKTKLVQILTNLLNNALKFTHQGQIELGYNLRKNEIEFYVKDTGIGIDTEMQGKIFERFRQADKSIQVNYGGAGLGLAISKAFAELLGGKFGLQSEPENRPAGKAGGSTFYFTIPYKPVNDKDITMTPTKQKGNATTILVAEDDEYNYLLIEELLRDMDIILIHAKDGIETVEICKNNPKINLILMDVKMPLMDGGEAAKLIKEKMPDLPIIAQSAYALEQEIEKFSEIFDDYITKPINEEIFIETIRKYIKR